MHLMKLSLILDATTGQNAINQVEEFKKISPITGIIMTKTRWNSKRRNIISNWEKI